MSNSLFAQVQIDMTMLQSGGDDQVDKVTSSAQYCKHSSCIEAMNTMHTACVMVQATCMTVQSE